MAAMVEVRAVAFLNDRQFDEKLLNPAWRHPPREHRGVQPSRRKVCHPIRCLCRRCAPRHYKASGAKSTAKTPLLASRSFDPKSGRVVTSQSEGERTLVEECRWHDKLNFPPDSGSIVTSAIAIFINSFAASNIPFWAPAIEAIRNITYTTVSSRKSVAESSIVALSLGVVVGRFNQKNLESIASRRYSMALRETNNALSNPELARSDDTLLSVILLGWFERLALVNQSVQNMDRHAAGAIALLRHRGPAQFADPKSNALFSMVRSGHIVESCLMSRPIAETDLEGLWFADAANAGDTFRDLYYRGRRIPTLRRRAALLLASTNPDPGATAVWQLLAETIAIDQQLQQWIQPFPIETVAVEGAPESVDGINDFDSATVWPGPVHVYENMSLSYNLNVCRMMRIFAQSINAQCLSFLETNGNIMPGGPRQFLYLSTLYSVQSLVHDIASSVPSQCAFGPGTKAGTGERRILQNEALGGCYLARPIWVASTVEGIDDRLRQWFRGRLKYIGERYGFKQATMLAKLKIEIPMTWRGITEPEKRAAVAGDLERHEARAARAGSMARTHHLNTVSS